MITTLWVFFFFFYVFQKCCKASRNLLEFLPDAFTVFWKNHLRELDFSENSLKEVPLGLFQLEVSVISSHLAYISLNTYSELSVIVVTAC